MFDTITMKKVAPNENQIPAEIAYELSGTGFEFTQKAFVEDIFVALPLQ